MMDYRFDPLWLKLAGMNIQGAQAMAPYLQMLEKQMGWSAGMASRVVDEYRKFLFLALRAGHQVIPPGMFQDMWTSQMQTAQDMFAQLGQVLGEKPAGGGFDASAFKAATDPWKQTLDSYEKLFGMAPPMDIWSKPAPQGNPFEAMMRNYWKMFGIRSE
jgi:hypothetical protein